MYLCLKKGRQGGMAKALLKNPLVIYFKHSNKKILLKHQFVPLLRAKTHSIILNIKSSNKDSPTNLIKSIEHLNDSTLHKRNEIKNTGIQS